MFFRQDQCWKTDCCCNDHHSCNSSECSHAIDDAGKGVWFLLEHGNISVLGFFPFFDYDGADGRGVRLEGVSEAISEPQVFLF